MSNITYEGDCLQILDSLKQTVDCIITDPPYCVANKNIIKFKNRKDMSRDLGDWDYYNDTKYNEFTINWMTKSLSLLKEHGNFITFCRLENITTFKNIYESLGLNHYATIIWHKVNPAPRVRKTGFLSSCEAILWGVKEPKNTKKKQYTFHFTKQNEMHNFIETPICMGKERTKHTTQKPLKVINKLVLTFTEENDLILDPFAGSGTLGISCNLLTRNSILIEKDPDSFQIMKNRLGF